MPKETTTPEEIDFETAMDSLESIVNSLEDDQLALSEMVDAYERGMALLKICRSRIDSARRRVELIQLKAEGNAPVGLSDFTATESPPAEVITKPTAPAKRGSSRHKDSTNSSADEEIRLF